ncbi:MAG: DUF721 domain-containing protein [Planctomycetota bacterium]
MNRSKDWPGLGARPLALREILENLRKNGPLRRRRVLSSAEKRWREAAGAELAAHTRTGSLRRGTLTVLCDSSALLAELSTFHGADILRRLQEAKGGPYVRKLEFRLANLSSETP